MLEYNLFPIEKNIQMLSRSNKDVNEFLYMYTNLV